MHGTEAKVAGVAAETRQAACAGACRADGRKERRRGRDIGWLLSRTARSVWAVAIVAGKVAEACIVGVAICGVVLNTSWLGEAFWYAHPGTDTRSNRALEQ
jgi:hypothetical protein